ncbi:CapA family protein [uncultured Rikenella sp.]|uniref:CapA family protein n=1 Tax=uncultured Rikenella sp. TaxID=368003 RepID=UPI00261E7C5D|nr:CapA family protein [uncultured Rikenella sp.]
MVLKYTVLGLAAFCWSCGTPGEPRARRDSSVLDSVVVRPELTLVFSGDVMQHLPQVAAARNEDGSFDYGSCFQYIAPFWKAADFAVVNLETTLSERGPYSGYPRFASPPALVSALKDAGVDVTVLANNHCCDRGWAGIRTTVRTVDSLGLRYAGVYTDSALSRIPLMLKKNRFRVALLNATYGTNGLPVPRGAVVHLIDTVRMAEEVRQARRDSATHIVLFVHWGEEYRQRPDDEQRQVAAWCRRQGIDAVIGSHPHVAQPIDTAQRIAWSLGNLVSNQRNRYRDGGLNVRLRLSFSGQPVIESLPHWVWLAGEGGRKRYYVVPAYVSGTEIGMDSLTNALFVRALEDNRTVAGAVEEAVL